MSETVIDVPPWRPISRLWFAVVTLFVLALGALEGWYGKTAAGDVYGSDAVQYLDIAQAFDRGDFHSALNPLWSQGYPALLSVVRPAFAATREGEWNAIRALNLAIFALCWLCFAALVRDLLRNRQRPTLTLVGAVCIFVTTQVCIDQVSRVGPDQLVAALFFLVCTLLLRLRRRQSWAHAAALGVVLGMGFLVKAIFLPLGCVAIALAFFVNRKPWKAVVSAAIFVAVVFAYGIALSRAVGYATLGDAGSLNYAWHVDRLAKWVHWEGGVEPADKAWPKPWIARFAHWQSDPPDFGTPIHPSAIEGVEPAIYVFHAPVQATYVPYFDPPYWYRGYRHVVRWRYQLIALGKNTGDLLVVVLRQPLFWAIFLLVFLKPHARWEDVAAAWPAAALALAGIAIYLPVHLEGRYLAPFLAVIGLAVILKSTPTAKNAALLMFCFSFVLGVFRDQRDVWSRADHRWDYRRIEEWREGRALQPELQPGSQIGVISWSPNVQCDWAYLAGLRITSEIASPEDERAFWSLAPAARSAVLERFHHAGAALVITRDKPPADSTGWTQLSGVPMWVYRF